MLQALSASGCSSGMGKMIVCEAVDANMRWELQKTRTPATKHPTAPL